MRSIWVDFWGPRMEQILRHAASALIEIPNASLVLLPRLLTDDDYRKTVVARISNPFTRSFFDNRFEHWRDAYREEAIDPVLNKVEAFLAFPHVRNILGQGRSTMHLEQAMQCGRIVIVNLAKSKIGETAAHLMGSFLIARVLAKLSTGLGQDYHLHIDEAHNFGSLSLLLQEARKFKVSVAAVSQYLAALDPATRSALMGTARTHAYFRLGSEDAELIAPGLNLEYREYNPHVLQHLPRAVAVVRRPGCDPAEVESPALARGEGNPAAVIKQSRLHYGVPRENVERNILWALGM